MRRRLTDDETAPVLLPEPREWTSLADVEAYACACIDICGPEGWRMQWDHAVRRLGCCRIHQRVISISRYFAETYLHKDPELIRRTVLHELAHALAWEYCRERNHGKAWRRICCQLGISGERSVCKCEDFSPVEKRREPLFALCNRETGEVYRYYYRSPRITPRRLRRCYIPGQKDATLGKLQIVDLRPTDPDSPPESGSQR